MIAAVVLALAVNPSTPVAPQPTPLRTVVYKASSLRKESLSIGTYGGHVAQPSGGGFGEPAPTSKNNAVELDGTVTIDVIGIQQDVIKVNVTETFIQRPTPATYAAYIAPNGLVRFDTQDPSPIARYLLPLFGSKFAADQTLNDGDSWNVNLKTDAVDVENKFTVTGQNGPLILLKQTGTVKLTSAQGMNLNVEGKLAYKPSLLVPVNGDINEHGMSSTMDSTDEMTTTVHFERVSDTLDQPSPSK